MSRKLVCSIVLVVVIMGVLGVSFNVHKVEALPETIYIKADGSVEGTTYIVSGDNVTYVFTADINDSIIVERSNIIVDGDGHTLDGLGSLLYGFNLTSVSNVTIRNLNVMGFGYGIYLQSSILNIILENNITFNEGNIYLGNSSDNTITGNAITDGAEAIQLYASSNNTISGNSMRDNSIGVWSRLNSAENVISGNIITANTNDGINLHYSHDNTISGNDVTNNWRGIDLSASSNNTLSGNTVTGNEEGISAGGALVNSVYVRSMNNTILGNNIVNNTNGVAIIGVLFTTISRNHIAENSQYGITLDGASNNTISANDITNNNLGIFYDGDCNNNTAYHNNFIDNTKQVEVSLGDIDAWDDGVEGNYWSDYTGVDSNRDGIGESWHEISENNTDHYPLMGMFHSFNTTLGKYVNVISNSTIDSFRYFESNSTIIMHVSNMTANQTNGLCRVSIPYEVMSEPFNATIDGANPTYWNYTLYDNGTHRWIYFAYGHSTLEIIIVPEFPSFLVLPLFMVATLLAVIAHRKKHPKMIARKKKRGVGLNPSRSL
jgi:parallel beta-helix repeat protein